MIDGRCRLCQAVAVGIEFGRASTAEEIAAVQRLRYAVYVDEMGRYDDVAGADEGRFAEPEDDHSWIYFAGDGDEVVAATRITWGGDGFSQRQIDQYQLGPFLAEIPTAMMAVGERNSVLPAHRGSGVLDGLLMFSGTDMFTSAPDLRMVFGCCEPHLLPMYLKMGQRTYAANNINSPSAGYLIPLVAFVPDVDALRGVGVGAAPDALPGSVAEVLDRGGSVRSEALTAHDDYWGEIRQTLDALDAQQIAAFDGFSDDEAQRCIARSTIIECAPATVCSRAAARCATSSSSCRAPSRCATTKDASSTCCARGTRSARWPSCWSGRARSSSTRPPTAHAC